MKRLILPAVFLILLSSSMVRAQQSASPQVRQVSATPTAPSQPVMTPRQLAELRADILVARKMYPQAVSAYLRLARQEPKNPQLLNKLGMVYEMWGINGRAEHWFKQAIKADRTYASAFNNVGTVEYAKHHYKGSEKWYKKALKLRPDLAPVYSNLGYAYFDNKKYPLAMAAFEKAIELDPLIFQEHGEGGSVVQQRGMSNPGLFYYFVARTYAQLGNAERAAHYLTMSRDDGYAKYTAAKADPAFSRVIKSSLVQAVFAPVPEMVDNPRSR